jgi:hypothetical protein
MLFYEILIEGSIRVINGLLSQLTQDNTLESLIAESNQFNSLEELINFVADQIDPTPESKFTTLVVIWIRNGEIEFSRIKEDASIIKENLIKYLEFSTQEGFRLRIAKVGFANFVKAIRDWSMKTADTDNVATRFVPEKFKLNFSLTHLLTRPFNRGDIFIDSPNMLITAPSTPQQGANCAHKGKPNELQHCTRGEDQFNQYSGQGQLYHVSANQNGKLRDFLFHYESDQFKDENNRELNTSDIALLSRHPAYASFLNSMIKKHYSKYFK